MNGIPQGLTGRGRRPLQATVGALVLISVAALAVAFDWNWLKGPLERYVSGITGRTFAIRGDLDVDLGSITRIDGTHVSLGNAPWASSRDLVSAERVRIDFALWPLLAGRSRGPRIELERPVLDLERGAGGEPNWRLRNAARPSLKRIDFGDLVVHGGTVRLREPRLRTDLLVRVDSAPPGADEVSARLVARGAGRYRNSGFTLSASVDPPLHLLEHGRGYRIDVRARAGATRARIHGSVPTPIDPDRFELQAEFSGQDLADLFPLLGFALPESPPYELRGWLGRSGKRIYYRDFEGMIGDSDLRGDLTIFLGGERIDVRGELVSHHLDFDDLAVLVGAPPDTGAGETANASQEAEARRRARAARVLPNREYNLKKLRSLDADVQLRASDVESKKWPIDSLHAHLTLDSGVLRVRPLDVGLAGGNVHGDITLDARRDLIAAVAELRASGVELPQLFPRLKVTSVGIIGGEATIQGRGNSVAQMLATANGEVATVMGTGAVSNLLLELAGLDIAESLKFLLGKDRSVRLRCAYADFKVDDGVVRTRAMVFDTTDTLILGKGSLSLRNEELDLVLRPRPKDLSPVSLRVPLEVRGTFKDPSFRPQPGPLAARAAVATALYAIAPPVALLALIETGPGEDVGCRPAAGASATGSTSPMPDSTDDEPGDMDRRRPRWKGPGRRRCA